MSPRKSRSTKKEKRPPVDWSKVPVVIVGTPNPEAIRLIQESMREFAYREWLKKQAATAQVVAVDTSISCSQNSTGS